MGSLRPFRGNAERQAEFGPLAYAPTTGGNIRITNGWASQNLVTVHVPQLAKVPGVPMTIGGERRTVGAGPKSGRVSLHYKAADAMLWLWDAWERAGLLPLVLTWAGMWCPRFIRGSDSVLSNHAFGTAFDINAPWNGLGRKPVPVGARGSVLELVPLAEEAGWYWGGSFKSRCDGMHFELGRWED
jgi:hypothetical protein